MPSSDSLAFEDTPPHGNSVRRLGRYVICRELGVGGMARVHLARMDGEAGFAKLVALKTIHRHLAGEQTFVDMFLDEARLASMINHRNVCAVFDFGRAEGTYFLAMEYLVGEPLSRIISVLRKSGRPEDLAELPKYAARLISDAAEGLHAAHELRGEDGTLLGVVHRDVSPQNLFVTFDGTAKVVDFGCAKAAQRISHTDTGMLKGKVSYAAPEQMKQEVVDRRADIWALGVCLWELLTLERLFNRHSDIASAMAVLDDTIPLASDVAPSAPPELAAIAAKALSRDPDKRYATMRELSRDLRTWLARSGEAVDAAEMAEWMDQLFAGRRSEQLAIVEEAKSAIVAQPTPNTTPRPSTAPTRAPMLSLDDADEVRQRKKKRSGGMGLAIFGVLALGLAGVTGWAWYSGRLDAWIGSGATTAPIAAVAEPTAPEPIAEPTPPPVAEPAPVPEPPAATTPVPEPAPLPEAVAIAAPPAEVAPPPTAPPAEPGPRSPTRGSSDRRHGPATTVGFAQPTEPTTPTEIAPTEPAAPSPGFARIEAVGGWSEIFEGDRRLGRTPLRVSLPAGQHTLRLLPFGNEPASLQTVRIFAGVEITVRVVLSESPGATSTPAPPTGSEP